MATIKSRIGKDGKVSWRAQIRLKGFPMQSRTFESQKDAKAWVAVTEGQIREGRFNYLPESQRKTLSDAIQRYIDFEVPRRRSDRKKVIYQLEWWRAQLGHLILKDVTTARVRQCQDKLEMSLSQRGTPMAPATVLRYMVTLSHLFSVASKQWEWTSDNPVLRVKKPVPNNTRDRVLGDEEKKLLLAACKASRCRYLYTAVVLALSTAGRRNEVLGLRWSDIDFNRRQLKFEKTKNGQKRSVPLPTSACAALLELKKVQMLHSPFVFPRDDGKAPQQIEKHWREALKAADVQDFRFHDLRHTAATNLAASGATLLQLKEILGHKTVQMVARYAHLTTNHNTEILERAAALMFSEAVYEGCYS